MIEMMRMINTPLIPPEGGRFGKRRASFNDNVQGTACNQSPPLAGAGGWTSPPLLEGAGGRSNVHTTSLRGTKQSRSNSKHSGLTLDCFTPFAMTATGHPVETRLIASLQSPNKFN